jgi:hypothetical protein
MRRTKPWWAIWLILLTASQASSQGMSSTPLVSSDIGSPVPVWVRAQAEGPQDQKKEPKQLPDEFTQAPGMGGEAPVGINPRMIGELPINSFALRFLTFGTTQTISTFQLATNIGNAPKVVPLTIQMPTTVTTFMRVPVFSGGASKIGENQSPMPEDRVFFTYNYYSDVRGPGGSFASPHIDTQQTVLNGFPATVNTLIPGVPPVRADLHREVFGFEKTFLDGNASVGLRAPVFQSQGDGGFSQHDFGDLSLLVNYAFYRDPQSGDVFCGGLMVTVPTGPSIDTIAGNIHPTVLQPFLGYRWNEGPWYLQGFTSVAVPTDGREPTALFNDIGAGYWLYRSGPDALISAVIPTLEAHVTTPLNHRQATDALFLPDIVALTGGVHVGLGQRSILTFGVVTPVTGAPKPWAVEGLVQFNFRF